MLYLAPRFAVVYQEIRSELPAHSKLLFVVGVWVAENPLPVALLIAAPVLLAIGLILDRNLRQAAVSRMTRHRRVQQMIAPIEFTRLYSTLAMPVGSGLNVMPALQLAEGVDPPHAGASTGDDPALPLK